MRGTGRAAGRSEAGNSPRGEKRGKKAFPRGETGKGGDGETTLISCHLSITRIDFMFYDASKIPAVALGLV